MNAVVLVPGTLADFGGEGALRDLMVIWPEAEELGVTQRVLATFRLV